MLLLLSPFPLPELALVLDDAVVGQVKNEWIPILLLFLLISGGPTNDNVV